jgi:HAE1 family hydrophobic/amphiphilic exporter-1
MSAENPERRDDAVEPTAAGTDVPAETGYERTSAAEEFLPRLALDRRITALVLMLTFLVIGTIAALGIPLEMMPRGFESGMFNISARWQEAPAEEVLEKITKPLEEELATVPGLANVYSTSSTGSARLRLEFKPGSNMDVAYREVRDRLERAKARMPEDLDRIVIRKADDGQIPVFAFGIAVDPEVEDPWHLIQNEIITPLQRIDGIAAVNVQGLLQKEVLIELDRERTQAAGIDIFQLGQQLGSDNFTMASGFVESGGGRKLLLRSVAKYADLEALRHRRVGPDVRLGDIATIRYALPDVFFSARANSKPAYFALVQKESEANVIDVSKAVEATVEKIKANPRMRLVDVTVFFNQGKTILEALDSLVWSGITGALLAALILYFFLRRFRLTLIIALSIPLSIIIALGVMYFAGESLNILSLLALMISVGMVVDNSVVVAENIFRLHREGLSRRESCIHGAGEISLAIVMSTLTSIVVFLPVSLVEGQGQFFLLRLSIPITVSLLGSLLVALVFVPLACYLTMGTEIGEAAHAERSGAFRSAIRHAYELSFGVVNRAYSRLLATALRRRFDAILLMALLAAVGLAVSLKFTKVELVQEEQRGGFNVRAELPRSMTFEEAGEYGREIEKILEARKAEWDIGTYLILHRRTSAEIQGWFNVPRTNEVTLREVTDALLAAIPERAGVRVFTGQNDEAAAEKRELAAFTLTGEDAGHLEKVARELEAEWLQVEGVLGVRQGQEEATDEVAVTIDRDRAQRLSINPQAVAGVVRNSLGGRPLPKFYRDGREIPVRVRFEEQDRQSLGQLFDFRVPTATGELVSLSSIAEPSRLVAPAEIKRTNKQVARTLTFELEEGKEEETRARLGRRAAAVDLPENIRFGQPRRGAGGSEDFSGLIMALGLSIVFVYLLMGFLFESFVLPLSILTTIPLAFLGVIWGHGIAGMNIDALGMIGVVLLVGVVVNNGIVLIDYVNRLRAAGVERSQAILLATDRRFRPIMMTALTTILGMVPMLFSERTSIGLSYKSFAVGLIGGMSVATFLTLLVVPLAYTYFDDLRTATFQATARLFGKGQPAPAPKTVEDVAGG